MTEALGAALAAELEGRPTLEIGVGTGRIAMPLVERGISLTGVDLSRPMLRRALDKGLRAGLVADAAHLPFRDGAFDAAMTVHLTHLLADWAAVLGEVSRVTRTEYLTVIEAADPPRNGPASEYYRSLKEDGVRAQHPGLHEWRLAEQLPPDRLVPVTEYTARTHTDEILELLARRQWSNQWTVPEGAHERAVARARARFSLNTEILTPTRVRIAIWSIPRLRAFCDERARR